MSKPRDEKYVNKILLYVLWNEMLTGQTPESIKTLSDYMGVEFPFDLIEDCFLVVSGIERPAYRTYGVSAIDYDDMSSRVWDYITPVLLNMGYQCACNMQMYEDAKRLVVILHPLTESARKARSQAAMLVHETLQRCFEQYFLPEGDLIRNFTVYSEELRGCKEISTAFRALQELHALTFFSPAREFIAAAQINQLRIPCDQNRLHQSVRDMFALVYEARKEEALDMLRQEIRDKLRLGLDRLLCYRVASAILIRLMEAARIYDLATEELTSISITRFPSIDALFSALEAQIIRLIQALADSQRFYCPITRTAILYIKQNFTREVSLQALSDRMNTAPAYLSRLFNRDVGESIPSYIQNLRLQLAREYLTSTQMPIAQIAKDTGFSSSSYFCKVFRARMGDSPIVFRERFNAPQTGA